MIDIRFPEPDFRTRRASLAEEIFDPIRKKWVKLNPEEWVRLNMIQYMIQYCGIPASLIAVERQVKLTDSKRRFDIVVYDRGAKPWLIVECKAFGVDLSGKAISQVLAYVSKLPCRYVLISNGLFTYGWQVQDLGFVEMEDFPSFPV